MKEKLLIWGTITALTAFFPRSIQAQTTFAELMTESQDDELAQVTSVSQLSDVQPTDWAFQALQSLVERYGCIAGYPDGAFRGNRSATVNLSLPMNSVQLAIALQSVSSTLTQKWLNLSKMRWV